MYTRVKKSKSKNTSGENKGLGNGCKCKHRIAKPTRSKSMNQISRNHKTGGLNFRYEIWAVFEGYFPHVFSALGESAHSLLGRECSEGLELRLTRAYVRPTSRCWSLRQSSHPPRPLSLYHCSAHPHCGLSLLLPHIPAELPGRVVEPKCPS